MDIKESVREFVTATSPAAAARTEPVAADEPLLSSGILDSLGIYNLIVFLENRFGIEVRDQELHPENFGTIATIAAFVEAKQLSPAP
jgi:acyl carrier protein